MKRVLASLLVAGAVAVLLSGCATEQKAKAAEHPTAEHPSAEHPTAEHPSN